MSLQAAYTKKVFQFNFKARTSRGLMRDKTSWFVKVWDDTNPEMFGLGECGPLPGLSVDARPDLEEVLKGSIQALTGHATIAAGNLDTVVSSVVPPGFPSITFALETALLDLAAGGKRLIFDNTFVRGTPLPINGLIWMGDLDFTMHQINQKIAQGFTCIKLKVGGLDFDKECDVLQYIRKRYFRQAIEIRLDANGAFKPEEVLFRLTELAKYNVHSIEQPIKPGLPEMEELCRKSPIPVAFDEELIGIEGDAKKTLLTTLQPAFIILKPSLHGGMAGCREWITVAESLGIGWWITSALESNVGLNAICQFTANYPITMPQGLGTGAIYENNVPSPLCVEKGNIFWSESTSWDVEGLF